MAVKINGVGAGRNRLRDLVQNSLLLDRRLCCPSHSARVLYLQGTHHFISKSRELYHLNIVSLLNSVSCFRQLLISLADTEKRREEMTKKAKDKKDLTKTLVAIVIIFILCQVKPLKGALPFTSVCTKTSQ